MRSSDCWRSKALGKWVKVWEYVKCWDGRTKGKGWMAWALGKGIRDDRVSTAGPARSFDCSDSLFNEVLQDSVFDWDLAEGLLQEGSQTAFGYRHVTNSLVNNRPASGLEYRNVLHVGLLDGACELLKDRNVSCVRLNNSPQSAFDDRDVPCSRLDYWLAKPLQNWNVSNILFLLVREDFIDYGNMSGNCFSSRTKPAFDNGNVTHALIDDWAKSPLYSVCYTLWYCWTARVKGGDEAWRKYGEYRRQCTGTSCGRVL